MSGASGIDLAALSKAATNINNPTSATLPFFATVPPVTPPGQSTSPTDTIPKTTGFNILRYPKDGGVYYMLFLFCSFLRRSVEGETEIVSNGAVCLPIPAELSDAQEVQYNVENRAALLGAAEAAYEGLKAGNHAGALTNMAKGITIRSAGDILDIVHGAGRTLFNSLGVAPNPFMEVNLNTQNFKQHNFTWKFSPKNAQESQELKFIINTFKKHSLPSLDRGSGSLFLNYPDVILPIFIPNQDQMYAFKWCVAPNVTAHWASSGIPAFFAGTQAPAEIALQLHLQEIELWMQDDEFFKDKSI